MGGGGHTKLQSPILLHSWDSRKWGVSGFGGRLVWVQICWPDLLPPSLWAIAPSPDSYRHPVPALPGGCQATRQKAGKRPWHSAWLHPHCPMLLIVIRALRGFGVLCGVISTNDSRPHGPCVPAPLSSSLGTQGSSCSANTGSASTGVTG